MDKKRKKPNGYWTLELCRAEALKYQTREAFRRNSGSAYASAWRNGWHPELCAHMVRPAQHNKRWTADTLRAEAATHLGRAAFKKANGGAYVAAIRLGILDEVCAHMITLAAPVITKSVAAAAARKYSQRSDFQYGPDRQKYMAAHRKGWMDDICAHMVPGVSGFDPTVPGILYYYEIKGLYKLGITNRSVKLRVGTQYAEIRVIAVKHFKIGADAAEAERAIRNYVDDCHRYDGPPVLTNGGDSELYTCDILGLDLDYSRGSI